MSGGPGGQLPQKAQIHGGILLLPAVEPSDQAQYLCRAHSSAGQHVARAVLHVHGERTGLWVGLGAHGWPREVFSRALSAGGNGPRVQVSPERIQVHEGRTVKLYCRAPGVPSATITWRKEGGSLPPQVRRSIGGQAHKLNRVPALAPCPSPLHFLLHPLPFWSPTLPRGQPAQTSWQVAAVGLSFCSLTLPSSVPSWALMLALYLPVPFAPSVHPHWLVLAWRPRPLRQLAHLLSGRPSPSTQTLPH